MADRMFDLEGKGPFSEGEVRERPRDYRDEHGEEAAMRLRLVELPRDGGTMGRDLDVGEFLDD